MSMSVSWVRGMPLDLNCLHGFGGACGGTFAGACPRDPRACTV